MIEITKKNIRVWSMLGMRRILGPAMKDIIEQDRKVLFATADTGRYYAYDDLLRTYPENVVDVGIAEQNLIGASAGLQNEGFNVYAVTYATFLTSRALDQIRVNLGYMGLGVKLIGEAGGMCDGNFSATHMALEDISNTRNIPNMRVITPADGMELVKTLIALKDAAYPAYVRMTGRFPIPVIYREDYDFEIGKAVTLREGKDVAILSNGTLLGDVLKTAEMLAEKGVDCKVINLHTVKPLDEEALRAVAGCKLVVTAEEHLLYGGLGSAVAEFYAQEPIRPRMLMLSVGTQYPKAQEYDDLLKTCGLTAPQMAESILAKL
ncbi:MAG: transketolase C-terminal domain-containing protein [Clostridia bacterium]|jgi:transketolase